MKTFFLVFALFSVSVFAQGQSLGELADTLLIQSFTVDPSDTMLFVPSGNDAQWVNWDGDAQPTLCGDDTAVPGNWFWEEDLGQVNPVTNFAFTSCSYLFNESQQNFNWLITPPTFIPDSTTTLNWKSLSLEGPGFLDGYKVLLSTTSNEPYSGDFADTLFKAAEMLAFTVPQSLDPDDYVFSPGYVHANWYTDTAYFFPAAPGDGAYFGKLEPHTVSLKKFAGKTVYIAFLHDSTNDNILQIDDISIIQEKTSALRPLDRDPLAFTLLPNPAKGFTTARWNMPVPLDVRLTLTDYLGKLLWERSVSAGELSVQQIDLQRLPTGVYTLSLYAGKVQQTRLLVKQ